MRNWRSHLSAVWQLYCLNCILLWNVSCVVLIMDLKYCSFGPKPWLEPSCLICSMPGMMYGPLNFAALKTEPRSSTCSAKCIFSCIDTGVIIKIRRMVVVFPRDYALSKCNVYVWRAIIKNMPAIIKTPAKIFNHILWIDHPWQHYVHYGQWKAIILLLVVGLELSEAQGCQSEVATMSCTIALKHCPCICQFRHC